MTRALRRRASKSNPKQILPCASILANVASGKSLEGGYMNGLKSGYCVLREIGQS